MIFLPPALQVDTVGHIPSARRAAASTVCGDRWLVVHGGFDGSRCLSDAFVLDTQALVWRKLELDGNGSSATQLGPRALHSMCPFSHGLMVYGGACSNSVLNSCSLLHNSSMTKGQRLAFESHVIAGKLAALERQLAECSAEKHRHQAQLQKEAAEQQV